MSSKNFLFTRGWLQTLLIFGYCYDVLGLWERTWNLGNQSCFKATQRVIVRKIVNVFNGILDKFLLFLVCHACRKKVDRCIPQMFLPISIHIPCVAVHGILLWKWSRMSTFEFLPSSVPLAWPSNLFFFLFFTFTAPWLCNIQLVAGFYKNSILYSTFKNLIGILLK